mgnify:CR=1 FL=1
MRSMLTTAAIAVTDRLRVLLTTAAPRLRAAARGGGGASGGHDFSSCRKRRGPASTGMPRAASAAPEQRQGWNNASTPPGWSHGKKTGWHGAKMPPGLSRH